MRLNDRSMARAIVRTINVLASPGTPIIKQCPREKTAVSKSSTMCSWPTMTLAISAFRRLRLAPSFPIAARSSPLATGGVFSGLAVADMRVSLEVDQRRVQWRESLTQRHEDAEDCKGGSDHGRNVLMRKVCIAVRGRSHRTR